MQYWGKVIGVAVALMMGGGFWGVVLGLLVGHMFDIISSLRVVKAVAGSRRSVGRRWKMPATCWA